MQPENYDGFLKYLATVAASAVTGIAGWRVLRFLVDWRRSSTEMLNTSRTADLSTTELQDRLYRAALETAQKAVTEAMAAQRACAQSEIASGQCRYRLQQSEQCLWDCVDLLKEAGRDTAALELRIRKIHATPGPQTTEGE